MTGSSRVRRQRGESATDPARSAQRSQRLHVQGATARAQSPRQHAASESLCHVGTACKIQWGSVAPLGSFSTRVQEGALSQAVATVPRVKTGACGRFKSKRPRRKCAAQCSACLPLLGAEASYSTPTTLPSATPKSGGCNRTHVKSN